MLDRTVEEIMKFPIHFILGFNRSGTTLLLSYMRVHKDIETGFEEPDHLYRLVAKTTRYASDYEKYVNVPKDFVNSLQDRATVLFTKYFYSELAERYSKKMAVLKHPSLCSYFFRLSEMFTDAKFLILLRHPYDLTASVLYHIDHDPWDQARGIFPKEIPKLCKMIRKYYERQLLHGLPDNRSRQMKFEQFVTTPAETLATLFNFFGADQSEEVIGDILARGAKGSIPLAGRKIVSTQITPPENRFDQLSENIKKEIRELMHPLCEKMGYKEK